MSDYTGMGPNGARKQWRIVRDGDTRTAHRRSVVYLTKGLAEEAARELARQGQLYEVYVSSIGPERPDRDLIW